MISSERIMKCSAIFKGLVLGAVIGICLYALVAYAQQEMISVQATYVGVEKCKMCHAKQYEDFLKRKFSKTWKVLEMRGETENPECLACHTTGYGRPSGFVDEKTTPHLKFKQCEACHGSASFHVSDPDNKEYRKQLMDYIRDKDICIQCHTCVTFHSGGFKF